MTTSKLKITASALAVVATLALAGCGNDSAASGMPMGGGPSSTASSGTPAAGAHNEADVMFATMMLPHHQQAVDMSRLLLAKTGVPADVRTLARQIQDEQSPEITQLAGWLVGWGVPAASPMGGMDHDMGDGMMSQADMDKLENATGTDAARLYLTGMTAHHRGALAMARTELAQGQNADATTLAQSILTSQQAEIAEMARLRSAL